MSVYDYVKLNHPLFAEDQGETGQTHDTIAPFMEQYEIDGRIAQAKGR